MLPTGGTLPDAAWAHRHRLVLVLLTLHVAVLLAFGASRGLPLWHCAVDLAPIVLLTALAASRRLLHHRARAGVAATALLTCSAALVHLSDGATEAHFHFFLAVAVLSLYEDWRVWGVAAAYVLLHHGVLGTLAPRSVSDHAGAVREPWMWAAIHAGFIATIAIVHVHSWRSNERARQAADGAAARFRSAFADAPGGMAIVDEQGVVQEANAALAASLRLELDAVRGRHLEDHFPTRRARTEERHIRRADGTLGSALWRESRLEDRETESRVVHVVDISERHRAEAALTWQATHDTLTGLPNRSSFVTGVRDALDRRRASDHGPVAVLFVDVDDFKVVNDSLGHDAGDKLLEAVAQRLIGALRPRDVVARFGGDEFTVLLPDVEDEAHALRIADRLADALGPPVVVGGEQRFVTASIGLAMAADDRAGADTLLRDADAAMYRAKELGKARCEVFDDSMRHRALQRLELESALRDAMSDEQLFLVFQPQVRLPDGAVRGFEALLRWRHPRLGVVSPADFVPIAETTGLVVDIGAWVLREACRQAMAWNRPDLHLSVNVSPRQLGREFLDLVRDALAASGLEAYRLFLEITETALVADIETARRTLDDLQALGVRLAIDDFGVGHASLRHLRALLPVDALKIDKSFVDGILDSPQDRAIVESVVALASALGLETVAEGVEDAAQAAALSDMACPSAQGFHFSRPLSPDEVAALLAGTTAA